MKIYLLAVGKLKDKSIKEKINYYLSRLGRGFEIKIIEVPDSKAKEPEKMKKQEAEKLLEQIPQKAYLVVWDEKGELITSEEFARLIEKVINQGRELAFILGGAYGLGQAVKKRADKILALSKMTFPHELARLMVMEQLYRAFHILQKTGYHH